MGNGRQVFSFIFYKDTSEKQTLALLILWRRASLRIERSNIALRDRRSLTSLYSSVTLISSGSTMLNSRLGTRSKQSCLKDSDTKRWGRESNTNQTHMRIICILVCGGGGTDTVARMSSSLRDRWKMHVFLLCFFLKLLSLFFPLLFLVLSSSRTITARWCVSLSAVKETGL